MKRTIFVLTGVAVLLMGAYFATQLFAQAPAGAPAQVQGTRVAVVNVGIVFNKYKRAVALKGELETLIKPYKDESKKLNDVGKQWNDLAVKEPNPQKKQEYEGHVLKIKHQIEEKHRQFQLEVGKRQEENLTTLWKEVNLAIKEVSKMYGFQLVLAYGDPVEPQMLDQFPNINRKMQAMDMGSTMPLYIHESVDLSNIIVSTLNSWYDNQQKAVGTPTPPSK